MKFTSLEEKQINEILRRRVEFKKTKIMATLAMPSEVKTLVKNGILTPYSKEVARSLNWYNLTDKGAEVTGLQAEAAINP